MTRNSVPEGWQAIDSVQLPNQSNSSNSTAQPPAGWIPITANNLSVAQNPSIFNDPQHTIVNNLFSGQTPPTMGQALSAGAVGIGKGLQNILNSPIGANFGPATLLDPNTQNAINRNAQQFVNPATNFNINNALGINPTAQQTQIENAVANTLPIGTAVLGGGIGMSEDIPLALRDIYKLSPAEINSEFGSIHNFINQNYLLRKGISDNNYQGALNTYGSQLSDPLQELMSSGEPQYQTVKSMGSGKIAIDPMIIANKDPSQIPQLLQGGYIKQISGDNPIQAMASDYFDNEDDAKDFYALLKKSVPNSVFNGVTKNPTIQGLHDLAQSSNSASGSADTFGQRKDLSDFGSFIKDNYIVPHLQAQDAVNGTNTADAYSNANNYFKTEVAPFRSTPTINSIALGLQNTDKNVMPASPSNILNDINSARTTPSEYNFDENTGLPLSEIPQNHFLSNIQPQLQQMADQDNRIKLLKKIGGNSLGYGSLATLSYLLGTKNHF